MGLLNVYKFSNTIVPLLSNRFKVTFYTTNSPSEEWDETVTSFNVKSVEMPSYKIETDDTRIRFGNTQFVIPLLHFSDTELHITFTETDGFDVHRFLSTLMSDEYFNISNTIQIKIKVDELTYDMSNIISTRIFICRLLKFDQPTYASSSRSDIMEIGATFYVEYELNSLLDPTTVAQLKQTDKAKTLTDEQKIMPTEEEKATTCPADAIDINNIEADFGSFKKANPSVEEATADSTPTTGIDPSKPERRLLSDEKMLAIQNKLKKAGKKGVVEMTAKEYLDYKYTLEQKIKEEIESDIAKNSIASKYTKHIGANGAVYYSVKSNSKGQSLNRKDNDKNKLDDLMMHTTGDFFSSANAAIDSMKSDGESMVLFSDFALVKEESLYNGRGHAATGSSDNIESAVANNTFSVERNSGSGAYANGTLHFVGTNIKISDGESGNWQEELRNEGVNVDRTNASGKSDKQFGLGLTPTEISVMAAVLYDVNKNGSGSFDFKNASVYMPETRTEVKNNVLTTDKMQGTVLTSHDAVSVLTRKHGEMGAGNLIELQEGIASEFEKIDRAKAGEGYTYTAYP